MRIPDSHADLVSDFQEKMQYRANGDLSLLERRPMLDFRLLSTLDLHVSRFAFVDKAIIRNTRKTFRPSSRDFERVQFAEVAIGFSALDD
jgi:hypothetical protein